MDDTVSYLLCSTSTWETQETLSAIYSCRNNILKKSETTLQKSRCVELMNLKTNDVNSRRHSHRNLLHKEQPVFGKGLNLNDISSHPQDLPNHNVNTNYTYGVEFSVPNERKEAGFGLGNAEHQIKQLKNHTCDVCDEKLGSKKSLKLHMKRHTGEDLHYCSLCRKEFTQKSPLRRHWRNVHKMNKKLIGHRLPGSTGRRYSNLNTKVKNLAIQPRFNDDLSSGLMDMLCNKLNDKNNTNEDVLLSMGEKQPGFDRSDAGYPMRLEPGTCSAEVKSTDSIQFHTLAKPGRGCHKCDICGKEFCTKSSLAGHVAGHRKIHTHVRQHKCTFCSSIFTQKSSVVRHMQNIHGIYTGSFKIKATHIYL